MKKTGPSLDWCVVHLGDKENWWVDSISDKEPAPSRPTMSMIVPASSLPRSTDYISENDSHCYVPVVTLLISMYHDFRSCLQRASHDDALSARYSSRP